MKLFLSAAVLLAGASSTLAAPAKKSVTTGAARSVKMSNKATRSLVKQSRKLEEDEDEQEEDEEWGFLMGYKVKFVMCAAGEKIMGEGEYEYSSVVYRLCPDDATNDKESAFGCTDEEAYGDYVVGINTYVGAVSEALERAQENNNNNRRKLDEDEFQLNEYAECREADMDMDEDDEGRKKRKLEQEQMFYIGPACNEEGDDIVLDFFSNEACTTKAVSPYTYYELTGQNIPYYDGGLANLVAKNGFTSCTQYDDGNYEVSEMCQEIYENAGKCDATSSYSCDTIETLEAELKAAESPSSAGKVFLIIILVLLTLGLGWWAFKLYQKKKQAEAGTEGESSGPFNQLC